MAENSITGGCQCGAIRFRMKGPLAKAGICHCRMCQKAFGNFGAALIGVPLENFAWTRGTPAAFRSSPVVDRGFCAKCGTPLYMLEDNYPVIELSVGALDNPDLVSFDRQVGVESRLHWFATLHQLPGKTTGDDRTPEDLAKLKSLQHPDHDTNAWPPK